MPDACWRKINKRGVQIKSRGLEKIEKLISRGEGRFFGTPEHIHSPLRRQNKKLLCCFPQPVRPQATVQLYILRYCFSVRIGFNMNNKCRK